MVMEPVIICYCMFDSVGLHMVQAMNDFDPSRNYVPSL